MPLLVKPPAPVMFPAMLVLKAPVSVSTNAPVLTLPPKARPPALAFHVCALPSVRLLLIVCVLVLLFKIPAAVVIV